MSSRFYRGEQFGALDLGKGGTERNAITVAILTELPWSAFPATTT
jgi:hypothetical protein